MNALPPSFPPSLDAMAIGEMDAPLLHPALGENHAMKWDALHEAASAVAMLAGVGEDITPQRVREFPYRLKALDPWRQHLAERGMDDLKAIMEPGIEALVTVNENGLDTAVPAMALWREFVAARESLLALLPPS